MKIDVKDTGAQRPQSGAEVQRRQDARPAPERADTPGPGTTADQVQLTADVVQLHEAQQALADVPVVNKERVGEIREAIERGEYQIDADRIAQKMLEFEQDL